MATITVRFRGICCFIDKTSKMNPFNKRVVLPNGKSHQHGGKQEDHFSIIEFFADDLESAPDELRQFSYTRPGDSGQYRLILLEEAVHIELLTTPAESTVPAGRVTPGINLEESMIHLHELVPQKIQLKRALLGPAKEVDSTLVSAVVDLPKGVLMPGPPEPMITKFPGSPKFNERRAARWLDHIVEVKDEKDQDKKTEFGLRLTPIGKAQAESKVIWFKKTTRLITIANEPLRFIVGHFVTNPPKPVEKAAEKPAAATGPQTVAKPVTAAAPQCGMAPMTTDMDTPAGKPTGHFDMYWDLVADPPARPRPIPEPSLGLGPGCSPSNIP